MKSVINLLRKVPTHLRFATLALIAVIGFVLFGLGTDESIKGLAILGAAILVFVFLVFRYIIKSKSQL